MRKIREIFFPFTWHKSFPGAGGRGDRCGGNEPIYTVSLCFVKVLLSSWSFDFLAVPPISSLHPLGLLWAPAQTFKRLAFPFCDWRLHEWSNRETRAQQKNVESCRATTMPQDRAGYRWNCAIRGFRPWGVPTPLRFASAPLLRPMLKTLMLFSSPLGLL